MALGMDKAIKGGDGRAHVEDDGDWIPRLSPA
jgi:hypothetical protein